MSLPQNESVRRELQLLEHSVQQLLAQRQSFQFELNEITNALSELALTKEDVYRVMGNVMMRADKVRLSTELENRKKALELHLQALDKQEQLLEKKSADLRQKTVDKK